MGWRCQHVRCGAPHHASRQNGPAIWSTVILTHLAWNRSNFYALAIGILSDTLGKRCCIFRNCQFQYLKLAILLFFSLVVDGGIDSRSIKKSKKRVQEVEIEKAIEDGTITANPIYKIGNPYQVGGVWYYPERDLAYDETGIGSWYGDEFAGRLTANGEIFDPDMVTAAHKTLPMPSVVRVTNLDNGKSLVVRINDRGPFVAGRVIDLSREAARLIGYRDQGIARVRVQVLAEQTLRMEKLAKSGNFAEIIGDVVAMPIVAAVEQPEVSMTATSSTGKIVNSDAEDAISQRLSCWFAPGWRGDNSCPDQDPAMGAGRCLLCTGQRVKCAYQGRGCRHRSGIAG